MRTASPLSLSALEMFRQAANEGSIVAAAEKLNRVQSNVSARIRQLEVQLGVELLVRGPQGVALTEEGRTLLQYADRLISLSNEAVDAVNSAEPSGDFRIGAMESTAASRLPKILSLYHARFPNVHIHLETGTAGGLSHRLLSNEIDVAFVAEPLTTGDVVAEPVFEEQLVLVTPPSFSSLRSRQQIHGATIVAFEEGCAYRWHLQEWLNDENIQPNNVLSVGSYLAMLACVSAGTGYAVVPKSVLDMVASEGEFRWHKLPKRFSRIKTLLVWRESFNSPKLNALRALLSGNLRQE